VAKVGVRGTAVPGREGVGKPLGADPVDRDCENRVGDGGIARLEWPEGLRESADGGRGIEDDLCKGQGGRLS
jgi:hypothetical protein